MLHATRQGLTVLLLASLLSRPAAAAGKRVAKTQPSATSRAVQNAARGLQGMGVLDSNCAIPGPRTAMPWQDAVVYLYRLWRHAEVRMLGIGQAVRGPAGERGDKGEKGEKGEQGASGPALTPEQEFLLHSLGTEVAPELRSLRSELESLRKRVEELEARQSGPSQGTSAAPGRSLSPEMTISAGSAGATSVADLQTAAQGLSEALCRQAASIAALERALDDLTRNASQGAGANQAASVTAG